MPPGCMSTLYGADQRFVDTYFSTFPGYYDTMDAGVKDEHGYIKVSQDHSFTASPPGAGPG